MKTLLYPKELKKVYLLQLKASLNPGTIVSYKPLLLCCTSGLTFFLYSYGSSVHRGFAEAAGG